MKNYNDDEFEVLRKIETKKFTNQRDLASLLGFSLGKINYCLKELKKKGLIKINNFNKNHNKAVYVYLLTPKCFFKKTKLTLNFMKRKMREYDELEKEYKKIKKDNNFLD